MFVVMQWVDWLCMISMVFSCWKSCMEEAVLEVVYQNLCMWGCVAQHLLETVVYLILVRTTTDHILVWHV